MMVQIQPDHLKNRGSGPDLYAWSQTKPAAQTFVYVY